VRILFLLFIIYSANAESKIAPFNEIINSGKNDTLKCKELLLAVLNLKDTAPELAMLYVEIAEQTAAKSTLPMLHARSLWYKGLLLYNKDQYNASLQALLRANTIFDSLGAKSEAQDVQYNIANIYQDKGDFERALQLYLKAYQYSLIKNNADAIANDAMSVANTYHLLNNYEQAKFYYDKALKLTPRERNKKLYATIMVNIGIMEIDIKTKLDTALKKLLEGVAIMQSEKMEQDACIAYQSIGDIYLQKQNYKIAKAYYQKALKLALENEAKDEQRLAYKALSDVYEKTGDHQSALKYYKEYVVLNNTIYNAESNREQNSLILKYEIEKKEAAIREEQKIHNAVAGLEIKKQKLMRNFSFAFIGIIVFFGIMSFYRYRKTKQLEYKQALLNERLRISRELHDDMGSTLSSISVYSEVAKNRAKKNANETEVLEKIGDASRELIEKMSDIVWSLNPNNENFEQLKNRMMAFAAMMLTSKGIQFKFDIDDEIKNTAISPEQRKNIFLIFKEAINNIVKYSEAKEVKVKMNIRDNKLILSIVDNGVGFDSLSIGEERGEVYNGNGLKNMKARAEEIKAFYTVTSKLKEGVKVELVLNL
jgi:signal transduction histidine kinase